MGIVDAVRLVVRPGRISYLQARKDFQDQVPITTFHNLVVDDSIYSITHLFIKEFADYPTIIGLIYKQGTLAERFKALNFIKMIVNDMIVGSNPTGAFFKYFYL